MRKEYNKYTKIGDYSIAEQKAVYVPEFSINNDVMLTSRSRGELKREYARRIWQRYGDKHV